MSNVLPFDASAQVVAQTPLAHLERTWISSEVSLAEEALTGLMVLRGDPANAALQKAVKAVFGARLPERLSSSESATARLLWLGPDEFWIWCDHAELFAIEQAFLQHETGHCALVNNSGGFTRIALKGADAQTVLMKSVPYPVYADAFPVGKVVGTVFAKTQAVLCRRGEQHWEVVARRSYADYIWRWLVDAARAR